jgi:transcriptional regulator with XRE-family HTH domain
MSRAVSGISTDFFKGAIRRLRTTLSGIEGRDISQDEMARRIGCTVAAYIQWEQGKRTPAGDWLLKMQTLAQEAGALDAFRLHVPVPSESKSKESSKDHRHRILAILDEGMKYAEEIFQLAQQGDAEAAAALASMASRLNTLSKRGPTKDEGAAAAGETGAALPSRMGLTLEHAARERRDASSSAPSQLPSFGPSSSRRTKRSTRK